MKRQNFFAMVATLAILAGCAQGNIIAYQQMDPYQRTMAVSAPTGDLTFRVENVFLNNNFQIGAEGQQPVRNPRYSLQLTYSQDSAMDVCVPNFDPKYEYNLVITDLRMGGRVFAMHGTDCRDAILGHLDDYIKNKPL